MRRRNNSLWYELMLLALALTVLLLPACGRQEEKATATPSSTPIAAPKPTTRIVLQARVSKDSVVEEALKESIGVISKRLYALGVVDAVVQTRDENHIVVELPGVEPSDEVIKLITQRAYLDFRPPEIQNGRPVMLDGTVVNSVILSDLNKLKWIKPASGQEHLGGEYLDNAEVVLDQLNRSEVLLRFNSQGWQLLENISRELLSRWQPVSDDKALLAIFLDDELISVLVVQQVLTAESSVSITGLGLEQARMLAIQLKSGSLPLTLEVAPVWILSAGLNAVLYTYNAPLSAAAVFEKYADKIEVVWNFDSLTGMWSRYLPGLGDPKISTLTTLSLGNVYFIKVKDSKATFELHYGQ